MKKAVLIAGGLIGGFVFGLWFNLLFITESGIYSNGRIVNTKQEVLIDVREYRTLYFGGIIIHGDEFPILVPFFFGGIGAFIGLKMSKRTNESRTSRS